MPLVRAAARDHVNALGLCIPGLPPHWMQHSGEQALCLANLAVVQRTHHESWEDDSEVKAFML